MSGDRIGAAGGPAISGHATMPQGKLADRQPYYGNGAQPWDVMCGLEVPEGTTLAEAYAQGAVLKYVARYRNKQEVHSLESAQWYLARLLEFARARQR